MSIKNITNHNQLQPKNIDLELCPKSNLFGKKIAISFVIILLFFAYSNKIWAQIESLYNSSTEQFAGISTLMSATANNDIDGVKFFSKAGPSIINQRNKGGATSLHIACREGNVEIAKILIENGANVNLVDNEGWSPLMRASLNGNENLVDLLLKNGAKSQLLNSINESALIHATTSKCLGCINKIIENGNLIKTMDTLVLKSQIADAFLVARSQENKQSQGVLESFLDYVSKMSPLILKSSTPVEDEELPLISNQTKIPPIKSNKFPKNYTLKNQFEENLTPEQQNSYAVQEDPNISRITRNNQIAEPKIYEENISLNKNEITHPIISKSPKKFKFKPIKNSSDDLPQSPSVANINIPKKLKFSNQNNNTNLVNIPTKKVETIPVKKIEKKFKFKTGKQGIKSDYSISNVNINETKILKKYDANDENLLQNKFKNEDLNNNQINEDNLIEDKVQTDADAEDASKDNQNKFDQEDTIILIEKKSNFLNKKQSSPTDLPKNIIEPTNPNIYKKFKFKKQHFEPNKKQDIKNLNNIEPVDLKPVIIEEPKIKKFKLKKIENKKENQIVEENI